MMVEMILLMSNVARKATREVHNLTVMQSFNTRKTTCIPHYDIQNLRQYLIMISL